jgi:hypothetical protein
MLKLSTAFYALFVCSATACNVFTGEGTEFAPASTLTWHEVRLANGGDFTITDAAGDHDYLYTSAGTDLPYRMGVSPKDQNDVVLIRELDGKRWLVDMVIFTCSH